MGIRRKLPLLVWRIVNPIARRLAGVAPFWVVIETVGRKTGKVRKTPLARGPRDGNVTWVIAVHGRHSGFVKNLEANPQVRFRLRGRWHNATGSVHPMDPETVSRFSAYARSGPKSLGIDPVLVRVELSD